MSVETKTFFGAALSPKFLHIRGDLLGSRLTRLSHRLYSTATGRLFAYCGHSNKIPRTLNEPLRSTASPLATLARTVWNLEAVAPRAHTRLCATHNSARIYGISIQTTVKVLFDTRAWVTPNPSAVREGDSCATADL